MAHQEWHIFQPIDRSQPSDIELNQLRFHAGQMRVILSKLSDGQNFTNAWNCGRKARLDTLPPWPQEGVDGHDVCAWCLLVFPLDELHPGLTGTGLRWCRKHTGHCPVDLQALTQDWIASTTYSHFRIDDKRLGTSTRGPDWPSAPKLYNTAKKEAERLVSLSWTGECLQDMYTGKPLHSLVEEEHVYGETNSKYQINYVYIWRRNTDDSL